MASSERIFQLLDTPVDPAHALPSSADCAPPAPAGDSATAPGPGRRHRRRPFRGQIEFDHVWFAYQDERLGARGRLVPRRAGRAGRARRRHRRGQDHDHKLLLRFYDAAAGRDPRRRRRRARLGPRRRCAGASAWCSRTCSCSPARSQTNIALGDPDDRPATRSSAPRARCAPHDFIERLPQRLRHAGARARRRLSRPASASCSSFARALARDPAILMLDEATVERRHRDRAADPGRAATR